MFIPFCNVYSWWVISTERRRLYYSEIEAVRVGDMATIIAQVA